MKMGPLIKLSAVIQSLIYYYKPTCRMENSMDLDQLVSEEGL